MSGEENLWRAVVAQAIKDAVAGKTATDQKSAVQYIFSESDKNFFDFVNLTTFCGVNIKKIRCLIANYIVENCPRYLKTYLPQIKKYTNKSVKIEAYRDFRFGFNKGLK